VHVETVGAAVDLRGAHLDQVHQRLFDSGVMDEMLELVHAFDGFLRDLLEIDARRHQWSPFRFVCRDEWAAERMLWILPTFTERGATATALPLDFPFAFAQGSL